MGESINPEAGNVEPWMVERVRQLLLAFSSSRHVTSKEIARTLLIRDGEAQPLTRAVISEVIRQGLPIGAASDGYFLLRTEQELRDYLADLGARSHAIGQRALSVERAFRQYWEIPA